MNLIVLGGRMPVGRCVGLAVQTVLRYRSASAMPVSGLPMRTRSVSTPAPRSTRRIVPARSLT